MAQCARGQGTLRLGCWDRRPGRPGKGRASTAVVATWEGHAAHRGVCAAMFLQPEWVSISWASLVVQTVKNLPAKQETWGQSLGQ